MATLLHSESRRLYSWWWDSHNTPKNSKWLQENLTDMDAKIKSMIKLIEEDADSFARRAEMYYKKRPELMKLVEEFYRAYRALAERYNHATGELRHAHRTIAKAFPDQVPLEMGDDSPTSKSLEKDMEPLTPELNCHIRALFDSYELLDDAMKKSEGHTEDANLGMRRRGLKQLQDMFEAKEAMSQSSSPRDEMLHLSNENQDLKEKILQKTERAGKAESEVLGLNKALSDMNAEKEEVLFEYERCLGKLSSIEGELSDTQNDSIRLSEKASQTETEVRTLKEALIQLEADKNAGLVKHNEYLEKIANLEAIVSRLQEDMTGLDERAIEAEREAETLKTEISRLELEKEQVLHRYKHCLGNISDLENIITVMEDEVRLLKKQAERAEIEVSELNKALADLNKEKEASALRYECCLRKISELENEICSTKEEVKRLNNEILIGTEKLKNAEEKCTLFEMLNQTLQIEANNLSNKLAIKDQELYDKQEELKKLENILQNEHSHHAKVEATLQNLQSLHSQSQDECTALALELKNVLRMLKELEISKLSLEDKLQKAIDENETLSESSLSSVVAMENMQNEILSLRENKERLEKEVLHHTGISNSLQKEILCLEKDIEGLNMSYRALIEEVEAAGLDPKCVLTSMRSFHDDNSKVRQILEQEKMALLKKLEGMEELTNQKVIVESSLSDAHYELEISREKAKTLQESCETLHGETATLAFEKASLVSQIQAITENMHMLLDKNAVLENSLSTAKLELDGLRERSRGLEEICELLKNEKSCILTERGNLALKLESVEKRLEVLEKRFTDLEEKYADLEKEKAIIEYQVEDLKVSFDMEKQERTNSELQNETRLAELENEIHHLQEENIWKIKEFEEELEKALKAQFEISILQKFMKDMEEQNYSLTVECQNHVEASRLSEKLISELESESLEQQVEAELLLDEIERLRLGINQIFMALETDPGSAHVDKFENEQSFVNYILKIIEDMKCSVLKHEGDKQLLLVENSVLLTLLEQLETKGKEIDMQKILLEKEVQILGEKLTMVKNEKDQLLEMNEQLKLNTIEGHQHAGILETELRNLCLKQTDLDKAYCALEQAYSQVNRDNNDLLRKFSGLKKEKCEVDQQHDAILLELIETSNLSEVFKSFGTEKITEVKLLLGDLNRLYEVNNSLLVDTSVLAEKLELQKVENLQLKDAVHTLEKEILEMREYNARMNQDISIGKENLLQTETKVLDMELKLEIAESLKSDLCSKVEELKNDIQESLQIRENQEAKIFELSQENSVQNKEIENLNSVNANLKSELGLLREEIEEKIIREQTLSSELEDKNDEFELWEAEAASFCFDLQISSVNEVLFENKVKELTGVCETLQNDRASKNLEIEQMKGKFCLMEIENNKLKSQLSAYAPVIASLRDDITFLEHNALLQTKFKGSHIHNPEVLEVTNCRSNPEKLAEDEPLLDLQNLQFRIKEATKLMEETNKHVLLQQRKSNYNGKQEPSHEQSDSPKLEQIKIKPSEGQNVMLMKDIPLDQVSDNSLNGTRKRDEISRDDQMLELWETSDDGNIDQTNDESLYRTSKRDIVYDPPSADSDVEKELRVVSKRSTPPNQEVKNVKILERLGSDAQKLENLQATLKNMKLKLEMNKKKRKIASKDVDFETVKEQVLEAEETVENLVEMNCQMATEIKDCEFSSDDTKRKNVGEQAQKGSERIGRMQLEVQKIEYILLKMEDKRKSKSKNKLFVLREFIYGGKGNSGKRKKKGCGCLRPSTSRNERSD